MNNRAYLLEKTMTQCESSIYLKVKHDSREDSEFLELQAMAKLHHVELVPVDTESVISFNSKVFMHSDSGDFTLDWAKDFLAHKKKNYSLKNEPLAKSLGVTNTQVDHHIVDCTLGTGKDAILLLSFGVHLLAFERNPHVFILALDALRRARKDPEVGSHFGRLNVAYGQAIDANFQSEYQIAYFDPMYPQKKKKALPRKEMQVFKEIVGEDADISDVFESLRSKFRRVVLKRPLKSDLLGAGAVSFKGKTTRYDRYDS
jgi:16S rRNA (guanine1516-N2)-methyltransferase